MIANREKSDTVGDRRSGSALLLAMLLEAGAAVHRPVAGGLESDLRLTAALCAGGDEVLSLALARVLLGVTACLAALGLVEEALFLVELLLTCGEHKFLAALFAHQSFVLKDFVGCANHVFLFVHCFYLA